MKLTENDSKRSSGIDFDIPVQEWSSNLEITQDETMGKNSNVEGCSNHYDMGESIRKWESSRYMKI